MIENHLKLNIKWLNEFKMPIVAIDPPTTARILTIKS